jgi:hypothetical protein
MVHVSSTQTVAELYRRCSIANLDKSELICNCVPHSRRNFVLDVMLGSYRCNHTIYGGEIRAINGNEIQFDLVLSEGDCAHQENKYSHISQGLLLRRSVQPPKTPSEPGISLAAA